MRIVIGLVGALVFSLLLQFALGFPSWHQTMLVLACLVVYEEARGWLAPVFDAIEDLFNFLKRVALFLGAFIVAHWLAWQVFGVSFQVNLQKWQGVGVQGLLNPILRPSVREDLMQEIVLTLVLGVLCYLFAKEQFPPIHRQRQEARIDEHRNA